MKQLREEIEKEIRNGGEPHPENDDWIMHDPVTITLTANKLCLLFTQVLQSIEMEYSKVDGKLYTGQDGSITNYPPEAKVHDRIAREQNTKIAQLIQSLKEDTNAK